MPAESASARIIEAAEEEREGHLELSEDQAYVAYAAALAAFWLAAVAQRLGLGYLSAPLGLLLCLSVLKIRFKYTFALHRYSIACGIVLFCAAGVCAIGLSLRDVRVPALNDALVIFQLSIVCMHMRYTLARRRIGFQTLLLAACALGPALYVYQTSAARFCSVACGCVVISMLDSKSGKSVASEAPPIPATSVNLRDVLTAEEETLLAMSMVDPKDLELGKRIGVGSFANVYQGTYRGSLPVAIKVLSRRVVTERYIKCLALELVTMSQVRHTNVLRYMGYALSPYVCVITEFASRGSLGRALRDKNAHMAWIHPLRKILSDVCRGMAYLAEMGVVHNDLKADNVLLDLDWTAKIGDLGLVKRKNDTHTTQEGGSPGWISPEKLRGSIGNEKSDVFAFGVMLWEACSGGARPFMGMTEEEAATAVLAGKRPIPPASSPAPIVTIMRACMDTRPSKRPTFTELLSVLERAVAFELQALAAELAEDTRYSSSSSSDSYTRRQNIERFNNDSAQLSNHSSFTGVLPLGADSEPPPLSSEARTVVSNSKLFQAFQQHTRKEGEFSPHPGYKAKEPLPAAAEEEEELSDAAPLMRATRMALATAATSASHTRTTARPHLSTIGETERLPEVSAASPLVRAARLASSRQAASPVIAAAMEEAEVSDASPLMRATRLASRARAPRDAAMTAAMEEAELSDASPLMRATRIASEHTNMGKIFKSPKPGQEDDELSDASPLMRATRRALEEVKSLEHVLPKLVYPTRSPPQQPPKLVYDSDTALTSASTSRSTVKKPKIMQEYSDYTST